MDVFRCQFDGEILENNIYEICFQHLVGVPLSIEENGEWVQADKWAPLKEFETALTERLDAHNKTIAKSYYTDMFYAGSDFMKVLSQVALVCAIARAPFAKHSITHLSLCA